MRNGTYEDNINVQVRNAQDEHKIGLAHVITHLQANTNEMYGKIF